MPLHPSLAPVHGSLVGPWRILQRYDSGSYGVVYRVEHAGHAELGCFALKLALRPEDPRFQREVELLQRVVHPSVPRFEDQGGWTGPDGRIYPYVVMEWVEGTPLYEWAREQQRTPREVLQVLAQLARALAVAHAVEGLHRDVKGDNVLVTSEGRAVLLDWGSGTYEGAKQLTDTMFPPGTSKYRAPEALRWGWAHERTGEPYEAGPLDDVYALGVTGYRLSTGTYPLLPEEGSGSQRRLIPPRELATVSMGLERFLLAALAQERRSRPPAEALAASFLEAAQEKDAARPIRPTRAAAKTELTSRPGPPRELVVPRWIAAVGAVLLGGLAVLAVLLSRHPVKPEPNSYVAEEQRHSPVREVSDAGVGDEALLSLQDVPRAVVPFMLRVGVPIPKTPPEGQKKPPCGAGQVAVNGACWAGPIKGQETPCKQGLFDHEGECYFAVFDAPRQPASEDPR